MSPASLLTIGLGLALAPPADGDLARDLLYKSMRRALPVNVVAVIAQRDPRHPGMFQTIRMERDKRGRVHHTILQPLRMMGVETVDDGDRYQVYWPDKETLIDQDSPQRLPCDAERRIRLAVRNYDLRLGGRERIAGRDAVCVEAVPKHGAMETRRYWLDLRTGYPLRLVVGPAQDTTTMYDTKDVVFPRNLPDERFVLKPVGSVKVLKYARPRDLTPAAAREAMGFAPLVPDAMPLGFRMQEMQMTESERWRAVAIRITDGLVKATVYQWRAGEGKRMRSPENSSFAERDGVRVLLVSELPARLRDQILAAFVPPLRGSAGTKDGEETILSTGTFTSTSHR